MNIFAPKGKERNLTNMSDFCLKKFQANHGHHIMLYSEGGEADVRNMITLCPECHRDYHSGKIKLDISRF